MRIGLAYSVADGMDPSSALALAGEACAEGVEVGCAHAVDAMALGDEDLAARFADEARAAGAALTSLRLGCLCVEPALIGPPETVRLSRDLIARALRFAARAGVDMLTLPFFGRNAIELPEELDRAVEALDGLVDAAAAAGVVLGIESTLNVEQQRLLLNHLGGPGDVRIHFNTGVALARKLDAAVCIRDLGAEAIGMVRLQDVRIAEGRPPDYAVSLGAGNVDLPAVARALAAIGYDGWVLVEPPSAGEAKAAVAKARELLRAAAAP